jgi:hypothetical protein
MDKDKMKIKDLFFVGVFMLGTLILTIAGIGLLLSPDQSGRELASLTLTEDELVRARTLGRLPERETERGPTSQKIVDKRPAFQAGEKVVIHNRAFEFMPDWVAVKKNADEYSWALRSDVNSDQIAGLVVRGQQSQRPHVVTGALVVSDEVLKDGRWPYGGEIVHHWPHLNSVLIQLPLDEVIDVYSELQEDPELNVELELIDLPLRLR